ncbi:hypothetical protein D3C80_1611480 [compost metagenome]
MASASSSNAGSLDEELVSASASEEIYGLVATFREGSKVPFVSFSKSLYSLKMKRKRSKWEGVFVSTSSPSPCSAISFSAL